MNGLLNPPKRDATIDSEKTINEQIEDLPYDKKWELPRHQLKLGTFKVQYITVSMGQYNKC